MGQTSRRDILKALGIAGGANALASLAAPLAHAVAHSGIQFGTQTNAYPIDPKNFDTFLAALGKTKAIGFEGFETGFRNVISHADTSEAAQAAKEKIAATGLTFFGIHIFLPHAMYDTATLIAPASLYEKVAQTGKALGARTLICSGAAAESTDQLKSKIEGLNTAGAFAKKLGLAFAYHNEEPESGSKINELDTLYTHTDPDSVGFLFDVGHLFNLDGDVLEFIRKYHQRIIGLHLRDYKDHHQVVLGTGDLPLAQIAQTLERMHWKGWVETEEERLDGVKHGDEYLRPAFAAMKGAFTK
jgi:inosose dehydratase